MAKIKTVFSCQSCGYQSAKWLGRCPDCNTWNTFEEGEVAPKLSAKAVVRGEASVLSTPKTISKVEMKKYARFNTGWKEFDRVVGGVSLAVL